MSIERKVTIITGASQASTSRQRNPAAGPTNPVYRELNGTQTGSPRQHSRQNLLPRMRRRGVRPRITTIRLRKEIPVVSSVRCAEPTSSWPAERCEVPAVVGGAAPVSALTLRWALAVPATVARAGDRAARRFLNFFAASIANDNIRIAYYRAVCCMR